MVLNNKTKFHKKYLSKRADVDWDIRTYGRTGVTLNAPAGIKIVAG